MIPKLYAKENGYSPAFTSVGPVLNGIGAPMPPNFLVNNGFIPTHEVVLQSSGEMDSLLQNHRRKMLRRAANRRSAQLSRARKKAYMEDLKIENARLQKMVDILDSQPDLVLCVNGDGNITYISERARNFIKIDDSNVEDPTHINQILAPESIEIFMEAISQVKQTHVYTPQNQQNYSIISAVKEISIHDANGYPTAGYLRCAKVIRNPTIDDSNESGDGDSNSAPSRKAKKNSDSDTPSNSNAGNLIKQHPKDSTLAGAIALQSLQMMEGIAAGGSGVGHPSSSMVNHKPTSSSSSSSTMNMTNGMSNGHVDSNLMHKFNSGNSDANTSEDSNKSKPVTSGFDDDFEDEYVCVIRPADSSIPAGSNICFQAYLSTESMVEHDRRKNNDDLEQNPTHVDNTRGGSPSCSLSNDSGSDDKQGSYESGQSNNKNSTGTSSETFSDESS